MRWFVDSDLIRPASTAPELGMWPRQKSETVFKRKPPAIPGRFTCRTMIDQAGKRDGKKFPIYRDAPIFRTDRANVVTSLKKVDVLKEAKWERTS